MLALLAVLAFCMHDWLVSVALPALRVMHAVLAQLALNHFLALSALLSLLDLIARLV